MFTILHEVHFVLLLIGLLPVTLSKRAEALGKLRIQRSIFVFLTLQKPLTAHRIWKRLLKVLLKKPAKKKKNPIPISGNSKVKFET